MLRYLKRLHGIFLRFELRESFLLAEEPGEGVVEVLVGTLE
jgi:hypothetical protein